MTQRPAPICVTCTHFKAGYWTCAAFPGGIPEAIKSGSVDHRNAYPGDKGIRYTPVK